MEKQIDFALVIGIGSMIISLLGLTIVYFVVRYQRRFLQEQLRVQAIKNERQVEIFQAAIEAEERQKHIIARNLHDTISSQLAFVQQSLKTIIEQPTCRGDLKELLVGSSRILDKCHAGIREACFDLIPQSLIHLGLIKAFEHILFDLQAVYAINTNLNISESTAEALQRFSNSKSLQIYRVIQELLNNIRKHSHPSKVNLTINILSQQIQIELHYDGIGISDEDIPNLKKNGLGLNSIASRIVLLNADISYQASISGNIARLTIPV
jgi:signal transduction histidine kinase